MRWDRQIGIIDERFGTITVDVVRIAPVFCGLDAGGHGGEPRAGYAHAGTD
jgi:hypothetical protein